MKPTKNIPLKQWAIPLLLAAFLLPGCSITTENQATLTLATTTSTRDSGLLDELLPMFGEQTGIEVKVVAVGTGQALELGRRGDADVLLTHAPSAEQEFMDAGYGSERRPVMSNDFVLVGPEDDPAEVKGDSSIIEVFTQIAEKESPFVSRGDDSGTHKKERNIWKEANREPAGDWYIESGTGMAQTLRIAEEKQAYTLTDRSTFLAQRDQLTLVILVEGDPLLLNRYAVILINPEKHTHIHSKAARRFADFLLEPKTQQFISKYGQAKYGQPLFHPVEKSNIDE